MKRITLLAVILLALGGTTFASTLQNCGSCDGGVYTMNYETVSIGGATDVFNLFVTIDTTNYLYQSAYIHAIAPKVDSNYSSITLLQAPLGVAQWLLPQSGGINAGGCDGAGAGYFCTTTAGLGAPVSTHMNTFEWQIVVPHNTLLTATDASALKILFVNGEGTKVGALMSEEFTLDPRISTPEPASLALIGFGLTGLGFFSRRFRK